MLENKSFSADLPLLQTVWDSTSLSLFKQCPYKYYLTMIEQWASKETAIELSFGIAYHSALETFDKATASGMAYEDAVIEAVRTALIHTTFWTPKDNLRTRYTLCRAVVWYLEHFKDDNATTVILRNGQPAVELSFKFDTGVDSSTGETFILSGHMDRVVDYDNQIFVMDRKSTKSQITSQFFDRYTPDNQMSMYTLAGKVVLGLPISGVIIDAVHLAVSFCTFGRGFANRTPQMIDDWFEDTIFYLNLADKCAQEKHYPQNDLACNLYGGCQFKKICRKDPSVRQAFLEADFERRVWDPSKPR